MFIRLFIQPIDYNHEIGEGKAAKPVTHFCYDAKQKNAMCFSSHAGNLAPFNQGIVTIRKYFQAFLCGIEVSLCSSSGLHLFLPHACSATSGSLECCSYGSSYRVFIQY